MECLTWCYRQSGPWLRGSCVADEVGNDDCCDAVKCGTNQYSLFHFDQMIKPWTNTRDLSSNFFGRLSGCLGVFQFDCDCSPITTGIKGLCVSDADIFNKSNCQRRNIDLRRALSITAVKESCLQHCQNPLKYLTEKRWPGSKGAFIKGVEHGVFCLGYCGSLWRYCLWGESWTFIGSPD